jgi:hypothetical protein
MCIFVTVGVRVGDGWGTVDTFHFADCRRELSRCAPSCPTPTPMDTSRETNGQGNRQDCDPVGRRGSRGEEPDGGPYHEKHIERAKAQSFVHETSQSSVHLASRSHRACRRARAMPLGMQLSTSANQHPKIAATTVFHVTSTLPTSNSRTTYISKMKLNIRITFRCSTA